jgi:hypothetical protein
MPVMVTSKLVYSSILTVSLLLLTHLHPINSSPMFFEQIAQAKEMIQDGIAKNAKIV